MGRIMDQCLGAGYLSIRDLRFKPATAHEALPGLVVARQRT